MVYCTKVCRKSRAVVTIKGSGEATAIMKEMMAIYG